MFYVFFNLRILKISFKFSFNRNFLRQISKKLEGPERRLSHDKGPAPKPPTLPTPPIAATSETTRSSPPSTPITPPTEPLPSPIYPDPVLLPGKAPAKASKRDQIDNKITKAIEPLKPATETRDNTEIEQPRPVKAHLNGKRKPSSDLIEHRHDEEIDKSSCPVHKRPASKVPTPVRPVSMVNNVAEMPQEREEPERNRRTRSSSVSNRNRRRPSPPPLDRVLQIQAHDKILNKNEVFAREETQEVRVRDPFNESYGKDRKDSVVIASGKWTQEGNGRCMSGTKFVYIFIGESSKLNATTVRINNDPPVEVSNESLESNITIVTTTHPPVLHPGLDDSDGVVHNKFSSNQVVIVANENNKTRVSNRVAVRICHLNMK